MQYSPKLKKAAEEIKAVLKKHDIAASIILHTPGFSEFINHINTSYSCAQMEGDFLRIKGKLERDFHGDKKLQKQRLTDTINMLQHFADINGRNSLAFFELLDKVKESVDFSWDGDGNISSHVDQNN